MKVFILTRISEGDSVVVDGAFTTEAKAEKARKSLLKDFGESEDDYEDGNTEYHWEIHEEKVQ